MKLYLGVDGGQSGTTAVIGDEGGRILGTGTAGPCNHATEGEGRAKDDEVWNLVLYIRGLYKSAPAAPAQPSN